MKSPATYSVVTTHPGTGNDNNEIVKDVKIESFLEARKQNGFPTPEIAKSGLTLDEAISMTGYTREELGL